MTTPSTTLTAAREAERAAHEAAAAATKHREQVEKEVELERRPKVLHDGKLLVLSPDATRVECWRDGYRSATYSVDFVLALASLLPRKPVAISDEMVEKAYRAYLVTPGGPGGKDDIRAALSAVAADLSAPVAVAAPTLGTPVAGYVAMGKNNTSPHFCALLSDARRSASVRNSEPSWHHPFCVYALVPDGTEGAANG